MQKKKKFIDKFKELIVNNMKAIANFNNIPFKDQCFVIYHFKRISPWRKTITLNALLI